MAEAPGAPHRTTGSTLLHPLSALLGIPLDQVRLRAAAGPGGILSADPRPAGSARPSLSPVPAPGPREQRGEPAVGAGLGGGRAAVSRRGSVSFFPAIPGPFPALARSRCWMLLDAVSHGAGLTAAEFGMLQEPECWSTAGNRVGGCGVSCRESLRSGTAFVYTGL